MAKRDKVKSWIKRYLPSEISGTITAIVFASATYAVTKNDIATAYAGVCGENIGFYGVIIARDIHKSRKHHATTGKRYNHISFVKNIRDIILEFGPSEILDSFVIRPFLMYLGPKITGNIETGILIGKLGADVTFYIPAIFSYEMQQLFKKRQSNKQNTKENIKKSKKPQKKS